MNTPHPDPESTPANTTANNAEEPANGTVVPLRADTVSTADSIPQPRSADANDSQSAVLEDELVDDDTAISGPLSVDPPAEPGPSRFQRARAATVQPLVPDWARSRAEMADRARWVARYAGHSTAFHTLRTPRYAAGLAARAPRGLGRVTLATYRWVYDAEGKPLRADAVTRTDPDTYLKLAKLREQRVRKRLTVTLLAALAAALGLFLLLAYGSVWLQAAVFAAALGTLGWIGTHADRPVIGRAVVTDKAAKLTSDVVVRALSALGIAQINQAVTKGQGITFPAPITRDGPGWRAEVDLPYGVTVTDVMDKRDKLASGLRRPLGCVWPEPVSEEHAGRLVVWVGDEDMAKAKSAAWPLAKQGQADLFKDIPFGTDQRGRPITVGLMFANMVIGAMPRMGKTFALRVLVLAAALDSSVELRLFELKGTGDLGMAEQVCHAYASGADDDTLAIAMESLRELHKELERRSKAITRIAKQDPAACPENRVTPQLARNRKLGLHPVFAAVDECQELFSADEYKEEAKKLAEAIIKRGPAMGIMLVLATQRPDAASLPPGVSANAGIRFCLRVMGQTENDMVLGTSSYKNGIRATTFGAKDKGIGYLVGAADDPQIVRSYYVDGPAAETIAKRARHLREQAGTITGHAAGDVAEPEQNRSDVLADTLAVFEPGEERLWSDVIVARLAGRWPEAYGGYNAATLATALKPAGVTPGQVWDTDADGKRANRRGYQRDALATAHLNRQKGHRA